MTVIFGAKGIIIITISTEIITIIGNIVDITTIIMEGRYITHTLHTGLSKRESYMMK